MQASGKLMARQTCFWEVKRPAIQVLRSSANYDHFIAIWLAGFCYFLTGKV
jgi:hypothetical protein